MPIIPIGKNKLMVAQNLSNPFLPNYNQDYEEKPLQTDELQPEQNIEEQPIDEQPIEEQQVEQKNNTLTDYIFNVLQSFGYPGRRLEQYKKEFVQEEIASDGTSNKTVEIPDRYYPNEQGQIQSVEEKELTKIVKEVKEMFGLNFVNAKRSNGKWIINFTSAQKETNDEQVGFQDNLDEIYGSPSGEKKKVKKTTASTLKELLEAQKNDMFLKLNTIAEKKND